MNKMRSRLTKIPLLILLLFILTSCGFWMLPLRREKTATFAIRGANFSKTFKICVKAAEDIHFEVNWSRKRPGRFTAGRGFGIDEITTMRLDLKKGYRKKLYFIVTVKSSRGGKTIINKFINSVEKYLDTFPIQSPEDME